MGLSNNIRNIGGVVTVEIEGFFTERFINLCKINNVKIWDIRNVVKGMVRFKINVSDFKKLRPISKKTKCKVKIKKKEGLYFTLFKYRKRKFAFFLVFMIIFFSIAFSTFVWDIKVEGNEKISTDKIVSSLKESGLYVGKCKIGLDKKEVINNLRVNLQEISWAGIDIDGTSITVKVVEKTNLEDKDIQNNKIGDIVANKSGVITRLVPENGTAILNEGSYVEKGGVLIEGRIYSKILEPKYVTAKGIIKVNCEYERNADYNYATILKEYTKKTRYTVGITVNSKESMLNYLNKSLKYDITKNSKCVNLFGLNISFDLYKCDEYFEKEIIRTKEELLNISKQDIDDYLNGEILPNAKNPQVVDINTEYIENENGITAKTKYVINEEIGEFVERENIVYEQ